MTQEKEGTLLDPAADLQAMSQQSRQTLSFNPCLFDTWATESHKRIQSASGTLGTELLCLALQEEALSLELSSKDTYEEASRQLAAALTPPLDDPQKLRFTQQNNYTQQPKPQAMRFPTQEQDLPDMLHHFGQTTDTLFYEVLDLPLPQLERLKTLKASLLTRLPCQSGS